MSIAMCSYSLHHSLPQNVMVTKNPFIKRAAQSSNVIQKII
jgi:hypothetical protein